MIAHRRRMPILVVLLALLAGVGIVPLSRAEAAPCAWGVQCNDVRLVEPTSGAVLSGSVALQATAGQATPDRGGIVKVEWWLYHPSFKEQTPENAEGKILLDEATAPSSGTRLNGTWSGSWKVAKLMTTRDGAYELLGTRTYTLPDDGRQYAIEAHVLDEEWVRTWGGPSGRTAPAEVTINFGETTPPKPAPPAPAPPAPAPPAPAVPAPAAPAQAGPAPAPAVPAPAMTTTRGTPAATLAATALKLASGKVRFTAVSNAKKVKVAYRTSTRKQRVVTLTVRRGMARGDLPRGTRAISAQARATSALPASAWVPVSVSERPAASLAGVTQRLSSGKVRVVVTSNAKKVVVAYRTATKKKRMTTLTVRRGTAGRTLARGSQTFVVRTKATSTLRASGWLPLSPAPTPGTTQTPGTTPTPGITPTPDTGAGTGPLPPATVAIPGTVTPIPGQPATPPVSSTPVGAGSWRVLPVQMPLRALHGTLLRDGRVLLIAGSGNDPDAFVAGTFRTVVWNPADDSFLDVPTPEDLFCSGHVTLADGRVLVAGGTTAFPGVNGEAAYLGAKYAYVFDPATNRFTRTNDMQEGHWYPTLTKLENGNVWAAGGYSERGDGASWNTEMFEASRGAWLSKAEVRQTEQNWGTYPHMFLLADGRMFYTGGHTFGGQKWNAATGAQLLDWRTGAVGDIPGLRDKDLRDQAGSVLLPPAQNQTFLIVGGGSTDNGGATNKADIVNLNDASPRYVPAADLPGTGRQYLNLTTLPNRTVLASNGGTTPRGGNVDDAAIYQPTDGTWTRVPADPIGRNYHSAALLLPDGRVAVFGSNPADNSFELRISIYTPAFAQAGVARPEVTSVSTGEEATFGEAFDIGVSGDVVAASLTSPGSSTHQTDTNMRLVDLPITGSGTARRVTVPTNPALLPPGPYMLTVLTGAGVPSMARWINIR